MEPQQIFTELLLAYSLRDDNLENCLITKFPDESNFIRKNIEFLRDLPEHWSEERIDKSRKVEPITDPFGLNKV